MYLKSLKLVGFKSFADRTRLEFRPGVSVIVGPNGSGKSNIVDALAWVMGTQSPKALRTQKMDDVIFAGTATRPGLGRAEVTLVLDNGSGALPLDLPEVSITRRLYRDGSSDYEINGVSCRLLDIQELLSDSGVGRHQHVIIGQGQIDSVLNAGPEDHRAVIEEAAGILKHRVRKDKALRRLERTDADVLRLRDLLGELARQMRPLKRQARAAERYQGLVEEVRALRLFVTGEELRSIDRRRREVAAEVQSLTEGLDRNDAEIVGVAAVLRELREDAGEVGEALDRDSSAAARIETTVERLRRIASVAHERHRAARARLEGAEERLRDLTGELTQLEDDLAAAQAESSVSGAESAAAERRFRALEDEERSLADQESLSTEGAIAIVRGELRALEAADDRDRRESEAVGKRRDLLASQVSEARDEVERVNVEIQELDAVVGAAQGRYEEATGNRNRAQQTWERSEADLNDARIAVAAARAKLDALGEAVSGVADPEARSQVERAAGALGSIAARLDVPPHLSAAVDAALGPWVDAVVFGAPEEVEAAVAALKGQGRGGIPLVVGASAAAAPADLRGLGLEPLIALLGPAADRDLARRLLGDVVVCEGWHAAWGIVIRNPHLRVVTSEGDLITTDGIRVAHPDGATPAMLEIAGVELEAAETDLARATSLHTQARREFETARDDERRVLESLEALEARLAGATEAHARLGRTLGSLTQESANVDERWRALAEAVSARTDHKARLKARLEALEGEEAERQRAWEELTIRRTAVAAAREKARAEWQEAAAAHRAVVERIEIIQRRLTAIEASVSAETGQPEDPSRLDRLGVIEETARTALEHLGRHLGELRTRQAELRSKAGETGRRLSEYQSRFDELGRAVQEAKDRRAVLAVEAAELRVRAEAVGEGLRRDLDASEDDALAAPAPESDGEDLVGRLEAREAELRRMGAVNPLAAEEYAALGERHEFLATQLDDLESSRTELRKVIRALDDEIQDQFAIAFREIAHAFETHFALLFPGGRGRLRLTHPDEPLTSGVEIEAQPLGKKISRMTLLSGGERSLAALAFMFSVFRARPSPFYVLDEVEAALDDTNLRRFLRLLVAFRQNAQLLVITHQQQTMEAADVLYGVTMEPGGSSKAVTKVLGELDRPAELPAITG